MYNCDNCDNKFISNKQLISHLEKCKEKNSIHSKSNYIKLIKELRDNRTYLKSKIESLEEEITDYKKGVSIQETHIEKLDEKISKYIEEQSSITKEHNKILETQKEELEHEYKGHIQIIIDKHTEEVERLEKDIEKSNNKVKSETEKYNKEIKFIQTHLHTEINVLKDIYTKDLEDIKKERDTLFKELEELGDVKKERDILFIEVEEL